MQWLRRDLVTSPYHIGICLSESSFERELKRLKVKRDQWPRFCNSGADASTHFLEQTGGIGLIAVVCLHPPKNKTGIQVAALLVHEAIHIWQAIREDLGEKSPSSEFEAYSIQAISQSLMNGYVSERKRKR